MVLGQLCGMNHTAAAVRFASQAVRAERTQARLGGGAFFGARSIRGDVPTLTALGQVVGHQGAPQPADQRLEALRIFQEQRVYG